MKGNKQSKVVKRESWTINLSNLSPTINVRR